MQVELRVFGRVRLSYLSFLRVSGEHAMLERYYSDAIGHDIRAPEDS